MQVVKNILNRCHARVYKKILSSIQIETPSACDHDFVFIWRKRGGLPFSATPVVGDVKALTYFVILLLEYECVSSYGTQVRSCHHMF